jgi:signal transduction histidine kinase
MTNLIKNAIEATSGTDGARVIVEVGEGGDPKGSTLYISVTDNGPGLRAEDEATIFEPYVTTKKEGTGLGLPISHRIAVEHGGDLTYTTPKSGGARFVFSLPKSGPPILAEPAD